MSGANACECCVRVSALAIPCETMKQTQHFGSSSGIDKPTSSESILKMAIQHSPRDLLQAAMEEIRQLREERDQQQSRFEREMQQREEELRQLERRITSRESNQLSLSDNRRNI